MLRIIVMALVCGAALSCGGGENFLVHCPERGNFGPSSGYYSWFYEDYILARVFSDVKRGTYIDVGANQPEAGSVTKYFYDRGWRGVNIEPNPALFGLIQKSRAGDINLNIGISNTSGNLTFYRFNVEHGLSTFNRNIALGHAKKGHTFDEIPVSVRTLNDVIVENHLTDRDIDFVNIDVEGFEKAVLEGFDLVRYHPKVIMIEATEPMTEAPSHYRWERILIENGYLFAMYDGLNRYYVHRESRYLLERFSEASLCVSMDKIKRKINLDGWKADSR
jgi:FkbM family methyltransferase